MTVLQLKSKKVCICNLWTKTTSMNLFPHHVLVWVSDMKRAVTF